MNDDTQKTNIGYCLRCGRPISGNPRAFLGSDPAELTSALAKCGKCKRADRLCLRVPKVPRYQCHYLSNQGDETGQPFRLGMGDIHRFVTAEVYELFFPDAWNGFKQVCKAEDIPPLCEVSLPESHLRQGFPVDAVLLVASFVASGIIGGVAYDIVKHQGRILWDKLSAADRKKVAPLLKEAPYKTAEAFDRVFESAFIYLNRRLVGLQALASPDGALYRSAKFLVRKNGCVRCRELAAHLSCSVQDSKALLRLLGAEYSLSRRVWQLPERLLRHYKGLPALNKVAEDESNRPFYAKGDASREVAWNLDIPSPPGLSEDQEMDFEVSVMQATTPDTEAFLRGEISDQELQQRVYIKVGALARSLLKKQKKSQQGAGPNERERGHAH